MKNYQYEYIFVGAGPSAICAIVKLLGKGVPGDKIGWIDPQFKVGDFGTRWKDVPGNTKVESYQKVNREILKILRDFDGNRKFKLDNFPSDFACSLADATEPMQAITDHLLEIVTHIKSTVTKIIRDPQGWKIKMADPVENVFLTKRVILATGVKTKTMPLPVEVKQIPLEIAADKNQLQQMANELGTVAVIGSSHSAALATMHLLQCGANVIQFMRAPYKFATSITLNKVASTLFDNTGLKGQVADWTRELITTGHNKQYAGKIKFCSSEEEALKTHLPTCDHVVFAIGLEPVNNIQIENYFPIEIKYDPKTSIICDGIFGIGAAFPLQITDRFGVTENVVGIGKFWFDLSEKVLAIWDSYTAVCSNKLQNEKQVDLPVACLEENGFFHVKFENNQGKKPQPFFQLRAKF